MTSPIQPIRIEAKNAETDILAELTEKQRGPFLAEMNARRKNKSTAIFLNLFLGGLGAHHFYLEKNGDGILCVLFVWTFIPALLATYDLFFCTSWYVDQYNQKLAQEVAAKMKLAFPANPPAPDTTPASNNQP